MGARGIQIGRSFGAIPNKLSDISGGSDLENLVNQLKDRVGKLPELSELMTRKESEETVQHIQEGISNAINDTIDALGLARVEDIPEAPTMADYAQTDDKQLSFIKNKPKFKRDETYSGATGVGGNWIFVFTTPFTDVPNVTPSLPNQSDGNLVVRVSSVSKTGFTINVSKRAVATVLTVEVALPGLNGLAGVNVDVRVREK